VDQSGSNFDSPPKHVDKSGSRDENYAAAFQFGWRSYLQLGRSTVTERLGFEMIEPALKEEWNKQGRAASNQLTWEAARDAARDAWNQVQDALAKGADTKSSAR
jgi:hypothetical protein